MLGEVALLGQRPVGPGQRCLLIAEVGQAHDGNINAAHAYIDAVATTGVDAVKFQTHIASEESTPAEPWRVRFSHQDATRYDYWHRMEFPASAWQELAAHAQETQLLFLSSAFSEAAVDLLDDLVPAWKVASGEIGNLPLLRRMAETGKPVMLSSGLSPWSEIDTAVETVRKLDAPVIMFQATTSYPCPPEKLGLNVLEEFRRRYQCPVGLSDHSATVHAAIAATALGADLIEVHVALSPYSFGPDTSSSLVPGKLTELAAGVRFVESALANPIDKDAAAASMGDLRRMFGRSVVARRSMPAGTVLTVGDLALKKPGTGIPAALVDAVAGRVLRTSVNVDDLICEEDLD